MWLRFQNAVAQLATFHRALFVLSTVGIAICGSALANDLSTPKAWALVVGFAALLICGDILRTTEDRASQLTQHTKQSPKKARQDVFASGEPHVASASFAIGTVIILIVLTTHLLG